MGLSNAATGAGTANNRALWMDNDGKVGFGVLTLEPPDPDEPDEVNDPEPNFVRSAVTYNDGRWHHAVGTFSGTHIRLYVDGVLVAQYLRTIEDDPVIAAAPGFVRVGYLDLSSFYTVFGRNFDGRRAPTNSFFKGGLDEPSVHSRALTPVEVSRLWTSGAATLAP
jgi:hypothetical protein